MKFTGVSFRQSSFVILALNEAEIAGKYYMSHSSDLFLKTL